MKIAFVADGRSPTAISWTKYFVDQGHEVHFISSHRANPKTNYTSFHYLPIGFSGITNASNSINVRQKFIKNITTVKFRTFIKQWLTPIMLKNSTKKLSKLFKEIKPDVIHALRIPFEGIVSAKAAGDTPLIISVWGNDFTLHAKSNRMMKKLTISALQRTNALLADCNRDIREANDLGFNQNKTSLVLPGGGGLDPNVFYENKMPPPPYQIINPRGLRAYIRNDTFFKAIPLVATKYPNIKFIFPAMEGESEAIKLVNQYKIHSHVDLLQKQTPEQMAKLFQNSVIIASPSEHDGTPNTLLEGMACGCFPIAGNIESIREWITDNENGLLFNVENHLDIAAAIINALENPKLRDKAKNINRGLIKERAIYANVMKQAEFFYNELLKKDA